MINTRSELLDKGNRHNRLEEYFYIEGQQVREEYREGEGENKKIDRARHDKYMYIHRQIDRARHDKYMYIHIYIERKKGSRNFKNEKREKDSERLRYSMRTLCKQYANTMQML